MNQRILVVDDDKKAAELIKLYLERDRYRVALAHDGRQALELARLQRPDLVVLDLMLPGLDGVEVCRALQAETQVPVIMLTARVTEEDKLLGLDVGADDYITKPFSPRELVARVRAVLRRAGAEAAPTGPLQARGLILDLQQHEARLNGLPLRLTPKEFKLLETFMREPGRAFTRLELLGQVFGFGYEGLERTVDVHVMNLRRKIEGTEPHSSFIATVYGVGYKFVEGHDDVT